MKYISFIFVALALLIAQQGFAASCAIDKQQMYDQIARDDSISTKKCPLNRNGWVITRVSGEKKAGNNTCTAKCAYYSAEKK